MNVGMFVAVFALLVLPAPAGAQERSFNSGSSAPVWRPYSVASQPAAPVPVSKLLPGAIIGGVAGLFVGGGLGALVAGANRCAEEAWVCSVHGAMLGAVLGESVGIPVGVRAAGGRRSFGSSLAGSLALGLAGFAGIRASHFDTPQTPIILVLTPALQIALSVTLARR